MRRSHRQHPLLGEDRTSISGCSTHNRFRDPRCFTPFLGDFQVSETALNTLGILDQQFPNRFNSWTHKHLQRTFILNPSRAVAGVTSDSSPGHGRWDRAVLCGASKSLSRREKSGDSSDLKVSSTHYRPNTRTISPCDRRPVELSERSLIRELVTGLW